MKLLYPEVLHERFYDIPPKVSQGFLVEFLQILFQENPSEKFQEAPVGIYIGIPGVLPGIASEISLEMYFRIL